MSDDFLGRILDLDSRAEAVRARAKEEADGIRGETAKRLEEAKAQQERETAEAAAAIKARAERDREAELAKLRQRLKDEADAVRQVPQGKMDAAVRSVVDKLRRA